MNMGMARSTTIAMTISAMAAVPTARATDPEPEPEVVILEPERARPYKDLSPAEAMEVISNQPRDEQWAPLAEAQLRRTFPERPFDGDERSVVVKCYSFDCSIEFFTKTPHSENADLLFEVVRKLEGATAGYNLFSEGPTDQRLLVIVEFSSKDRTFARLRGFFETK